MSSLTTKILYRTTTILLAAFVLPGIFFMNSELAKQGMAHLSVPVWLGHLVGYGQPLGVLILLLAPRALYRLKERAYVALGIVYVSALYAHIVVDGVVLASFAPLITLGLLIVSYLTRHRLIDKK